ncbi:hypothetical protein NKI12_29120 [Mesorhizobium australicum]|uniref:Uncharacterized protein n=1 Tax=Mesorhizobium australicum TaxID=536018 RepID=A0ACC6T7N1_9HYPH
MSVKSDWFVQWASWSLGLEPGSLEVTPQGESSAQAVFAMSYDYTPKDKPAARVAGSAADAGIGQDREGITHRVGDVAGDVTTTVG